jgi:hypothetical protein
MAPLISLSYLLNLNLYHYFYLYLLKTNYMLCKMEDEGAAYCDALKGEWMANNYIATHSC